MFVDALRVGNAFSVESAGCYETGRDEPKVGVGAGVPAAMAVILER